MDQDTDEDNDDDLLSAAVAAAEAEDLEAKRGRRKFSLLQKGSLKHGKPSEKGKEGSEHLQQEQQPKGRENTPVREFTPQQKVNVRSAHLRSRNSAQERVF